MILGRSRLLWMGLATAILNGAVVVFGVPLTGEQVAAINAVVVAILGILANEADPTTAGTFALTTKAPADGATAP